MPTWFCLGKTWANPCHYLALCFICQPAAGVCPTPAQPMQVTWACPCRACLGPTWAMLMGNLNQNIPSCPCLKYIRSVHLGGGNCGQIFHFGVCTYIWKDLPKLGTHLPNMGTLVTSSYPNIEENGRSAIQSEMRKK